MAIGTDINGVPGNMTGYENPSDAHRIPEMLTDAGFSAPEIKMICGENFLRLFSDSC